jgi:hypothetical protein
MGTRGNIFQIKGNMTSIMVRMNNVATLKNSMTRVLKGDDVLE